MKDMTQKAIWSTGTIFLMSILSSLLGYILRLVLARSLVPDEYGLIYAVMAFFGIFTLFQYLGLGTASVKYIAEFRAKKRMGDVKRVIKTTFSIWLGVSFLIGLFILPFAGWFAENYFHEAASLRLIVIFAFVIMFSPLEAIFKTLFQGFQESLYFSLINIVKMGTVLGVTILLLYLGVGVESLFWAYLFAYLPLIVLFSVLFFRRVFPGITKIKAPYKWSITRKLFAFGLPVILTTVAGTAFTYTDTIVITLFRSLDEVGLYNVGMPTARVLWLFSNALIVVLFPLVSELWTKKRKKALSEGLAMLYKYASILIIPTSMIMVVFPKIILKLLFGDVYGPASGVLRIISFGTIVFSLANINNSVLAGIGKPKTVSKIMLSAAIFNLVANLFFVPSMGIEGAALSTLLSFIIVLVFSLIQVRRHIPFSLSGMLFLKIVLASSLFTVAIGLLKGLIILNPWLEIGLSVFVGGSIYSVAIFLLRIVSIDEIRSLLSRIKP